MTAGPATAGAKVVVADDDAALVSTLSWILKEHGYEVIAVPNGENLLERLAIIVEGPEIRTEDLAPYLAPGASGDPAPQAGAAAGSLRDLERRQVVAALDRSGWNQSRAARELGITLRQIGYKIKKFGLEDAVTEGRARSAARPAH